MYCSNCGREGKEGELFCAGCGAPKGQKVVSPTPQNVPVQQVQPTNASPVQPKRKMPTWLTVLLIIGITFLVIVVGFVLFIWFLFASVSNYEEPIYEQTESYVYLSGDDVPTIYELMGEYEMCESPDYSYYDSREDTDYYYCDDYMDTYILDEYADILIDDYGFKEYEVHDDRRVLIKDSFEEGYVIQVTVFYYRESVEYSRIDKENYDDLDNSL